MRIYLLIGGGVMRLERLSQCVGEDKLLSRDREKVVIMFGRGIACLSMLGRHWGVELGELDPLLRDKLAYTCRIRIS